VHACRARPLPDYSRLAAAGVYHHNTNSSNTSVLQLTDPQPFKLSTEVRGEVKSERAKAIIAAQEAAAAAAREVTTTGTCLLTIYIYILFRSMSLLRFILNRVCALQDARE
jgi:ribosomal protein S11